jgi:hypothetical protein
VRRVAALTAAASLAALAAGCGGEEAPPAAWEGPAQPLPADGSLPVEAFARYAERVDERWERSPALVAAEFLRLDRAEAGRTALAADTGPEGAGPATVTVTLAGLLDDSVEAERFTLRLVREGEVWRLERADWAQRCRPGRGHRGFSAARCL